jgi:toxin ParE1/3/4
MAYRLAPEAEADLEDIAFHVYVDSGSLEIPDRLIHSIAERFELLAAHPRAGRARDELLAGVRSFPVGEYLLLYRIEREGVVILRIVRGSRDLDALFEE